MQISDIISRLPLSPQRPNAYQSFQECKELNQNVTALMDQLVRDEEGSDLAPTALSLRQQVRDAATTPSTNPVEVFQATRQAALCGSLCGALDAAIFMAMTSEQQRDPRTDSFTLPEHLQTLQDQAELAHKQDAEAMQPRVQLAMLSGTTEALEKIWGNLRLGPEYTEMYCTATAEAAAEHCDTWPAASGQSREQKSRREIVAAFDQGYLMGSNTSFAYIINAGRPEPTPESQMGLKELLASKCEA